jgi:5S rRNA maturation endonuclease (ribonuclease M5)
MEISEIKSRLNIKAVLAHYGLGADSNKRVHCPFHEDKTPSMQVYFKTNTVYCFSAKCSTSGHSLDVIDFIMYKEKITKHEALKKASSMLEPAPENPSLIEHFKATEITNKNTKGEGYLVSRNLDYQILREKAQIRLGYNGDRRGANMANCVLFALRNSVGEVVSLYGRSIYNIAGKKHYYSQDRKGLFPFYPNPETKHLILCESLIDACTLVQYTDYTVLALYGTNGLTTEHLNALKGLHFLEEITLFFDGDEAGKKAIQSVSTRLQSVLNIALSYVQTPDNEDINSLVFSHEPNILDHLIKNRLDIVGTPIFFSNEIEKPSLPEVLKLPETASIFSIEKKEISVREPIEISPIIPKPTPPIIDEESEGGQLKIITPELLVYEINALKISILGGVRLTGLDRLRVTLKIEKTGLRIPLRHNLDLYHAVQLEGLHQKMIENLGLDHREVSQLIEGLISCLEQHRTERMQALQPKKEVVHRMSEQDRYEAIQYLKAPDLLARTALSIAQSGIVGEEMNAMIAFLIYTSRKRENPLHLMCLGASGTGKTYLQEKVGELMPTEEKLEITTLSENAFYYFGREELKHKLILIEDLDGATDVLYPLRELQSKRKITKTVTLKDSKGNLKTVSLTVEGPVSVSGCTTREKLYEDNANRCILVETDLSQKQDGLIMDYQRKLSAGLINKTQENQTKELLQNAQRILKPITIRNPFAPYINLPEVVFKPRRTIGLLLSFIETITFYHQYQLVVKTDPKTQEIYIETQVEHLEKAFELLKEALFRKSDELTGASRKFLETLKVHLTQEKITFFTAKEIRKTMKTGGVAMNPSNLKRYLIELERYGYVKGKGNRYKGYEYSVTDMNEYENLTKQIQGDLQAIIQKIKAK